MRIRRQAVTQVCRRHPVSVAWLTLSAIWLVFCLTTWGTKGVL